MAGSEPGAEISRHTQKMNPRGKEVNCKMIYFLLSQHGMESCLLKLVSRSLPKKVFNRLHTQERESD